MSVLRPTPVSSDRFTYSADGNLLVAEASDLGRHPFGQVYDDACDEGLTVISARTGREVVYAVSSVHRDTEGDLTHWDLRPVAPGDVGLPTLRIFND